MYVARYRARRRHGHRHNQEQSMTTDAPTRVDEARRIVADADAALVALPRAVAEREVAALANQNTIASNAWWLGEWEAMRLEAMRQGWGRAEARRAMEKAGRAVRMADIALGDVWATGDSLMAADAEVARLAALASGPLVDDARRVVRAADDRVVLRRVVDLPALDDEPEHRSARCRMM